MRSPKDWTDRVHPDDRPLFKYMLAEHLKGNTPRFSMELRYRDGAGNWRWARQAGIAVRGPDGRAQRMVGAAGDITEAKRDDEAMAASADLLKVMSRSPFELQTVLDTVVNSATRLCDADAALIFRRRFALPPRRGKRPESRAENFSGRATDRTKPQLGGWPRRAGAPYRPYSGRLRRRRVSVVRGRQSRQLSLHPGRSAAARGRTDRRDYAHSQYAASVQRPTDRADLNLCQPNRHCA
jgi:hypothetical protein